MKFLTGFSICLAFTMFTFTLSYDEDVPGSNDTDYDYYSGEYPTEWEELTYTCKDNPDPKWKCNCKMECDPANDEMDCEEDPNFPRVFICKDNSSSVFMPGHCEHRNKGHIIDGNSRFCDGVVTCHDKSDEPNGIFGLKCDVKQTVAKYTVTPKRGCTIPPHFIERWKNVSNIDLYKNNAMCPHEGDICYINGSFDHSKCFQCADGTVISTKQVCDGLIDCRDISDECLCKNISEDTKKFCSMQNHTQSTSEVFICQNNVTIIKEHICNETSLCDVSLCPSKNTTASYVCKEGISGKTVYATACDGRPECPGRIDDECEANCDITPQYCNTSVTYECENISNPKDSLLLCNGREECQNGKDERWCPTRVPCNNSAENITIDKNQLCDYKEDCEDSEDEKNCDRFYCEGGPTRGLWPGQIGDGKIDCTGGDDECDTSNGAFSSGQWMIQWPILVAIWIMALCALFGNGVVIVTCAKDLRETYHRGEGDSRGVRVGVCNKTLVLNLALADFLMGVYLLILGIKAIEYNSVYCIKGPEWRSSLLCSRIGALAMLSSQASVLIMVMMTTFRLYSVWSPFRVAERLKARFLVASVVILCWVPPLLLAIIPLHLVNSLAFAVLLKWRMPFSDSILLEKSEFSRIVERLREDYGDGKQLLGGSGWNDMINDFCRVFKEVCPEKHMDIVDKMYPYYSADSVCLPRLFPQIDDSGWDYTAGVVIFDFAAFVYILFAYVMMYVSTVRTNETRNENVTFRRSKEDRVIWQRISRLLITDFLCWMPICITCTISLAGYDIPPIMYQISAAIILPINSALNPLLYSNAVCKLLRRLGCVGWPNANCGRKLKKIEPHTNGALGTDNVQLETRSLTLSETDRNRNIITVTSPPSPRRSPRSAFLQSLARFKRLCSERQAYNVTEDESSFQRHRPKSQSTTSTSTTFTTCGQEV